MTDQENKVTLKVALEIDTTKIEALIKRLEEGLKLKKQLEGAGF